MKNKHVATKSELGQLGGGKCSCGKGFATLKMAEDHATEQNLIEANEAKAKLEIQADHAAPAEPTEKPAEEPQVGEPTKEPVKAPAAAVAAPVETETPRTPEEPKPASKPGATEGQIISNGPRGLTTSITNMEMADQMVLKYATTLINSLAAAEFQTRMKLIQRLNPKLASCTPQSLFMAMMACVHLRLMPNTAEQLAHIIPYGNEAQFQIGFRGLAELAYRTGNVVKIDAEVVMRGDEFDVSLGTDRQLIHRPNFDVDRSDPRLVTHAYATVLLKDGNSLFQVLTKNELDKIKNASKAHGPGTPWSTWEIEMDKKTAVKRLAKLLPASKEDNRLKQAAELDSIQEAGKRLVIDAETGEIFGEDPNALPAAVRAEIDEATTTQELASLIRSLPVADQKRAAGAVTAKLRELA